MALIVLTGPVRSGKSELAERLAAERGRAVVVAVAGWDGDEEMRRRIARHKDARPGHWKAVEAAVEPDWLGEVPHGSVLVVDCLGTLVGTACYAAVGEAEVAPPGAEAQVERAVIGLLDALLQRAGDTIVVTNEVGWGVVPAWPSARVFRDALGRANRRLVDAADAAYLVVDGRCIDLGRVPQSPAWPRQDIRDA